MQCRAGCAACCIVPSISTPIPGREGAPARPKPAGERCVQLDADGRCRIHGSAARPSVCGSLQASAAMCGTSTREAFVALRRLARATAPARDQPSAWNASAAELRQ